MYFTLLFKRSVKKKKEINFIQLLKKVTEKTFILLQKYQISTKR